MKKSVKIDDYQNVKQALENAIATVEKRVKKLSGQARKKRSDGVIDVTPDLALAADLDALCSARLALKKLLESKPTATHRTDSKSEALLDEPWKAWISVFLWDGAEGILLSEICSFKFQSDDSLHSLMARNMGFDSDKIKNGDHRIKTLQTYFKPNTQTKVKDEFFMERIRIIKNHQDQGLKRVQTEVIDKISEYLSTLPEGGKHEKVKKMFNHLKDKKQAYEDYLARAYSEEMKNFNSDQRKVFFQKNQQYVNESIAALRTADLEVHQDHAFRMIMAGAINALLAVSVVGLLVLAILSQPGFWISFETRGQQLGAKAEQIFGRIENIQEEEMTMTHNPMRKAKLASS